VAVRSGETLRIPRTGMLPQLADLVDSMLAADPVHRPTIGNVHTTLMAVRATPDDPAAPAPPEQPSRLRGKGLRATPPVPSDAAPRPAGRLVGKLLGKISDRSLP
jgi:hypothetical protein